MPHSLTTLQKQCQVKSPAALNRFSICIVSHQKATRTHDERGQCKFEVETDAAAQQVAGIRREEATEERVRRSQAINLLQEFGLQ